DEPHVEDLVNIVLILSGKGPTITKTITIAEILKRKMNNLHQYTQIGRYKVREKIDDAVNNILYGDDNEATASSNDEKDDNGNTGYHYIPLYKSRAMLGKHSE
ncbi:21922_t:CDS:2, partial [Cetraspora pellucida]